jgi:TonB family protein
MRAVYLFIILSTICFSTVKPAMAISEFCPARFVMEPVKQVDTTTTSLFGFELVAEGSRSVSAILAFDTGEGWFTASTPTMVLHEKDRHYTSPSATFIKRTWISPIMYLKFPSHVTISYAWVYSAQSTGDDFGWSKMGLVLCQPESGARSTNPLRQEQLVKLDPKDEDPLSAPPEAGAIIISADRSSALKKTDCATPFRDATTTKTYSPDYPDAERGRVGIDVTSTIQVAINPDGSLADAWIFYPSGFPDFDNEALQGARLSKYQNGIAYCEPVPGLFLFKVTFSPNH